MLRKRKPKDPKIIRVGDRVRIINPMFFIRVGYDYCYADAVKELNEPDNPIRTKVEELLRIIYSKPKSAIDSQDDTFSNLFIKLDRQAADPLTSRVAYLMVGAKKKVGAERKIFTKIREEFGGKEFFVNEVNFVKTGKHFPSCGGYDEYTGESDYEPGGIEKEKTHKILTIIEQKRPFDAQMILQIEATNVAKVMD